MNLDIRKTEQVQFWKNHLDKDWHRQIDLLLFCQPLVQLSSQLWWKSTVCWKLRKNPTNLCILFTFVDFFTFVEVIVSTIVSLCAFTKSFTWAIEQECLKVFWLWNFSSDYKKLLEMQNEIFSEDVEVALDFSFIQECSNCRTFWTPFSVPPMKQDVQIHLVGLAVANEVPLDLGAGILQLGVQRLLH